MVNHRLSDIRILKLAEMYEHAYEAFILDMATRYVQDPDVKTKLRTLAGPSDDHEARITGELERLNKDLGTVDRAAIERAALQDVIAVERAAREFYLKFVEEVHDPAVAELFRNLAREEAGHVRIAEAALALSDKKAGRPRLGPDTSRLLRMMADNASVDDLSPSRRTDAV